MISMLGLYRPRHTPLHHAPAWLKVLMLVAMAIVTVVASDPVTSVGLMCASVLLLISTEPPAKATAWAMLGTVLIAALSASLHLWRGDWARAIDVAADLIGIVALALAVTCSTSMAAMLDFVSTLARPIRFILPPETLGLMFALMLRALPEVARLYLESRMAARARGLERSVRAVVFPTTTRSVGFALQLGQALHARGIAEEARGSRKADKAEARGESRAARKATKRRRGKGAPAVADHELTKAEAFAVLGGGPSSAAAAGSSAGPSAARAGATATASPTAPELEDRPATRDDSPTQR
ncbi:energy-coupling factor transporter transmembrane protein EcfT [uncultured Demequina sp.]|uniref:energy-coupling factor transporter transmembrane component T family protein n=1 Tax=uncultured Demequina sp. TaxID=693499 RepID=UPI0025E3DD3E|nr:energy-coupling factor transporter transmembrane protein EcfT [uncultured Demequina sp.]